ncbi:MAG TPA: hypothetical protein VGN17_01100 [Bryobacteraceae bacterium]|jgi:hypothetical protein
MHQPLTSSEAVEAKLKNILEICLDFSAMTRVFAKGSYGQIIAELEICLLRMADVVDQTEYDGLHNDFCRWFAANIWTAERRTRSGQLRASLPASYGQAAKVLDVAAKVYFYYCSQPSPEIALRLVPLLHAALDTEMMHRLYPQSPDTLHDLDSAGYQLLQSLVVQTIAKANLLRVQYDDVMWRRLQRVTST